MAHAPDLADLAAPTAAPEGARPSRLDGLDALRVFAVLAMAVDHLLAMVFHVRIEPFGPRFPTRIAEPLFAVLLGYFLAGRPRGRVLRRGLEVLGAALLVNAFFYPVFGALEVLATLALVLALYCVLGERLVYLLPVFLLHPLDPTARLLDYPLGVVVSQVALGMLLRRGAPVALALGFAAAPLAIGPPSRYMALFTIPAALLVRVAERDRAGSFGALGAAFRRALSAATAGFS